MSQQTVPSAPTATANSFSVTNAFRDMGQQLVLQQIVQDLYALRNSLDDFIAQYNSHNHKTPTSNPGTTSAPTSDTPGSGSTGGTSNTHSAPGQLKCST